MLEGILLENNPSDLGLEDKRMVKKSEWRTDWKNYSHEEIKMCIKKRRNISKNRHQIYCRAMWRTLEKNRPMLTEVGRSMNIS